MTAPEPAVGPDRQRSRRGMSKRSSAAAKSVRIPRLLYSIPEAGKALGISPATAYRLARRGVIFTVEDFGRKKVPVKWLEDEIARHTVLARSA